MSQHKHLHSTSQVNQKNLLWATLLNFLISFVEIVGGIVSNSLALISDAIHNLSDAFAVLIAYISHRIGFKKQHQADKYHAVSKHDAEPVDVRPAASAGCICF